MRGRIGPQLIARRATTPTWGHCSRLAVKVLGAGANIVLPGDRLGRSTSVSQVPQACTRQAGRLTVHTLLKKRELIDLMCMASRCLGIQASCGRNDSARPVSLALPAILPRSYIHTCDWVGGVGRVKHRSTEIGDSMTTWSIVCWETLPERYG